MLIHFSFVEFVDRRAAVPLVFISASGSSVP
jgi:hypothetical protein